MTKFAVLVLIALAVGTFALDEKTTQVLFTKWMRDNNKVYATDVFQAKYTNWKANLQWVQEFNQRGLTFTVAMNQFSDLTSSEFNTIYNGLKLKKPITVSDIPLELNVALPASVDWRTKGVVTGIKNQGQCGSCWSFSTTGSLEGAHALHTGSLVGLSEQNLMDCSQAYGNQGCDGGLMDDAFQYIIANHGIDTEASYPYTAEDGPSCQYSAANCGSTLQAYTDVQGGSEGALQTAVATQGPVSVAIDASHPSFQMYSGGVYYEPACSSTQLDHGVLAVGYSSSGSQDYWIVKNSWGTGWGMNGYIWMARNQNNNCGIATMASFPNSAGANNC